EKSLSLRQPWLNDSRVFRAGCDNLVDAIKKELECTLYQDQITETNQLNVLSPKLVFSWQNCRVITDCPNNNIDRLPSNNSSLLKNHIESLRVKKAKYNGSIDKVAAEEVLRQHGEINDDGAVGEKKIALRRGLEKSVVEAHLAVV
ncbi:hypothetical protein pdam_00011092, partial [Pocillopora damicornis]